MREHETAKLGARERALFVEDHAIQVFPESDFVLLVGFKIQAVPLFHPGPIQFEALRGAAAGVMTPAVREQDAADVQKQAGDGNGFFHSSIFISAK